MKIKWQVTVDYDGTFATLSVHMTDNDKSLKQPLGPGVGEWWLWDGTVETLKLLILTEVSGCVCKYQTDPVGAWTSSKFTLIALALVWERKACTILNISYLLKVLLTLLSSSLTTATIKTYSLCPLITWASVSPCVLVEQSVPKRCLLFS